MLNECRKIVDLVFDFLSSTKQASSYFSLFSWMMSQTRAARSPWDSALTSPLPAAACDKDDAEEEVGKGGGKAVGENASFSFSLFSTVSTLISTAGSVFPGG